MGFYVRKSFGSRRLRVNVSKRGLGVSTGGKGFRVSSGPRGSYVNAGRGGLYYRKKLGTGGGRGSSGWGSSASSGLGVLVIVVVVVAAFVIHWLMVHPTIPVIGGLAVIFFYAARSACKAKTKKLIDGYKSLLDGFFLLSGSNSQLPALVVTRKKIAENTKLLAQAVQVEKQVYEALLDKILEDGAITPHEKEQLQKFESVAMSLDDDFKTEEKKKLFHLSYLDAIADRGLTPEEVEKLKNLSHGLGLKETDIPDELKTIDEILKMQQLSLPLHPVTDPPVKLPTAETAFYSNSGQVLSRKKAKGEDSVYEYSVRRDGRLVITDKRILVVGEGTTTVKMGHVLDVDADLDHGMIVISKADSSVPTLIKCEEPLYCARMIDLLTEHGV